MPAPMPPAPALELRLDGTDHLVPAEAAPVTIGSDPLCDIVRPEGPARLAELHVVEGVWTLLVPVEMGTVVDRKSVV